MIKYFGLKGHPSLSLFVLRPVSNRMLLNLNEGEQRVLPFAFDSAHVKYVVWPRPYCHLENAPARGRPGNAVESRVDPGFCDVFTKVLQLVCCCLSGITFRSIFKALLTRSKLTFLLSEIQQAVIFFWRGIAICTTSGYYGANGAVSFSSRKLPFSLQFKWTNHEIFWVAFIGRLLSGKDRNACYLIGWFQCCLHLFVKIIFLFLWNTTRKKSPLSCSGH